MSKPVFDNTDAAQPHDGGTSDTVAGEGHNSGKTKMGGIAADRLKQIVARIERMNKDKKAVADDIKEIYAEAKGAGFDTKILRQVIKLRGMDKAAYQEQEALLDLYLQALGVFA